MSDSGITRVVDAWKLVGTDLANLGRRAVAGATGAAEQAGVAGGAKAAAAARGALGELGTGLASEGGADVLGREVEAAVKTSLDALGGALSRLAARLRNLDET